ncbi:hypothetical protein DFH05DRAFT_201243 [Lentinula detonsa]|uniref:Uncharacterized protein n=1 Tax=Lentinula detonsa TaxID=2804962 RepID=A0A9W8TVK9_9AGAR|nr:hypothetical protein DFH05DRAFT_201243 [Lentinula detonsa]
MAADIVDSNLVEEPLLSFKPSLPPAYLFNLTPHSLSPSELAQTSKRLSVDALALDDCLRDSIHSSKILAANTDKEHRPMQTQKPESNTRMASINGTTDGNRGEGGSKDRFATILNSESTRRIPNFSLKPATFSPAPSSIPIAGNNIDTSDDWSEDSESSDSENSPLRFRYSNFSLMHESNDVPRYASSDGGGDACGMNGQSAHEHMFNYNISPLERWTSGLSHFDNDLFPPPDARSSSAGSAKSSLTDELPFPDETMAASTNSLHLALHSREMSPLDSQTDSSTSSPPLAGRSPQWKPLALASVSNYRPSGISSSVPLVSENDHATAPSSPTDGESNIVDSCPRPYRKPPPWANFPPQPPLPRVPSTAKKRKRKTDNHQPVAVAHSPNAVHRTPTILKSVRASDASDSDATNPLTPIITYRLKTVNPENGTVKVVMKEDYMANFIQSKADLVLENTSRKEKKMGKKKESLMELSLDHRLKNRTKRLKCPTATQRSVRVPQGSVRTISLKPHSATSKSNRRPSPLICDSEGFLILVPSDSTSKTKQETTKAPKARKSRQTAAQAQKRMEKLEEREKLRNEKAMKEQRLCEEVEMERIQRENEMKELLALKERLYEAGVQLRYAEEKSKTVLPLQKDNDTPAIDSGQSNMMPVSSMDALWSVGITEEHPSVPHHSDHFATLNSTQYQGTQAQALRISKQTDHSPLSTYSEHILWKQKQTKADAIVRQKFASLSMLGMYSADATWEFKELGGKIENLGAGYTTNPSKS